MLRPVCTRKRFGRTPMATQRLLLRLAPLILGAAPVHCGGDARELRQALQAVADEMHVKYDMSISAALYSEELDVTVAAGYTTGGLGLGDRKRIALPDDLYVWGSTTKMFTAAAVLQLIEQGAIALTDPIEVRIDPILRALSGTTLAQHFGSAVHTVQIQHLLHMTSGIPDYDGEAYSKAQFHQRNKTFGPVEILLEYVSADLEYPPGTAQRYCSTNYILLGLVLAQHFHAVGSTWSWQGYDQTSVFPRAMRNAFQQSEFALKGPCQDYTPVHGFMESYDTASLPEQDVWNVSCVGGWTAGNYIGSARDVASFTYDLYNRRQPRIVSSASQGLMANFTAPGLPFKFYGMGTFNLDWSVGNTEAYGHVGDTYGYQSQTTYFPELDFALAVATNVETSSQAQPADFTCLAYHALVAVLQGTAPPNCTFRVSHRFIGTCTCTGAADARRDEVILV